MARLESQVKMGHYPTPLETLDYIKKWVFSHQSKNITMLDPCCGTGEAVNSLYGKIVYMNNAHAQTYGVELDRDRYEHARSNLSKSICASIYDMNIRPLESFSVLYLNPPYDWDHGERMEFSFLKHSHKWLKKGGLLMFLVPESILAYDKIRKWIVRRYGDIKVLKFTKGDYPSFKQVVVFGVKRNEESEDEMFPLSPYPHIEDAIFTSIFTSYTLIDGDKVDVFEAKGISEEEMVAYKETAMKNVKESLGIKTDRQDKHKTPIFPLRKGHLLSYLASGALDGQIGDMVVKCFTTRKSSSIDDTEKDKRITHETYAVCLRVIEGGKWYDVR